MGIIETLSSGISIIGIGINIYDWVTGHTVSKKLDELSGRLEKIDRHIYCLAQQEVWDKSVSRQNRINDLKLIKEAALPVQKSLGQELVVSTPIVIPNRLQAAFLSNPEEILFDIQPLRGQGIPDSYRNAPTMIPVIFNQWGQEFIGLIKSGYARDYLDVEYKPQSHLIVPSNCLPEETSRTIDEPVVHVLNELDGNQPVELLKHKDPFVRIEAAKILQIGGDDWAIQPLKARLKVEKNKDVRAAIKEALRRLKEFSRLEGIEWLGED